MMRILGVLALATAMAGLGCSQSDMNTSASSDNTLGAGADQSNPAEQERVRERDLSANGTSATGEQANGQLSSNDRKFVQDASAGGVYEVQEGQVAASKGTEDRVKTVGQRMVDDHTKANEDLTNIARRKGISTASGPNEEQQRMISKLQGLQGSDFDKEYLKQQEKAHRDTIAMFQKEARSGSDADLRSFASQTLPTLQEHLRMITGEKAGPRMGSER